MRAHQLVTPTSESEWDSFHRIRREVLFEAIARYAGSAAKPSRADVGDDDFDLDQLDIAV